MMKCDKYYRLWADVDLDAIRSNVVMLQKRLSPDVKTCAVIKADGYGHGAVQLARTLEDLADFYAVSTMDEAMELRENGILKPVLILGYIHHSLNETAIVNDIRLTVYDEQMAERISQAALRTGKTARIHIKIDTGMSRIGFSVCPQSVQAIRRICRLPGIEAEGIFTHFANADAETRDQTYQQLSLFRSVIDELETPGTAGSCGTQADAEPVIIPVKHCSNSAASTWLAESEQASDLQMNMVRMGVSIYGLYPSDYVHQLQLKPALSLKSHVIMVKTISAGTSVGYSSTWTAQRDSVIATIPVGYADGYFRSLSNKGWVLINGHRCRIAGRVCMDQMMVDVTDHPDVREGDVAVLIGRSGEEVITTEEIAQLAGSFNYEFVCGLSRRVPRKYYLGGEQIGVYDFFERSV